MCKISNEFVNFMKTWRVELTAGGKCLAEMKIQSWIFQVGALSPLLFLIAMTPLNHMLRKYTAGYEISKLQEKITHLMAEIKLVVKKKKN